MCRVIWVLSPLGKENSKSLVASESPNGDKRKTSLLSSVLAPVSHIFLPPSLLLLLALILLFFFSTHDGRTSLHFPSPAFGHRWCL